MSITVFGHGKPYVHIEISVVKHTICNMEVYHVEMSNGIAMAEQIQAMAKWGPLPTKLHKIRSWKITNLEM